MSDRHRADKRKILALDFDGVIHGYQSGWQGGTNIPDPPVEKALQYLRDMVGDPEIRPVIFSSRARHPNAITAIKRYLTSHGLEPHIVKQIEITAEKPPAWLTVDDRAWAFDGTFPTRKEVLNFRPWYMRDQEVT